MRTTLFLLILLSCCSSAFSKSIEAFVKNSVFYSPEAGTYVETDILITGPSINYVKNETGKFIGTVEITLLFKKVNEVMAFDKYLLHSIELDDTSGMSLIDKKRFLLLGGAYTLEATFKDINNAAPSYTYTEPLIVDFDADKVILSDIMLIDIYKQSDEKTIYERNGYHLSPYVLNFYPENINKLIFYAEVYNCDKLQDDKCLAVVSVKKFKENNVAGDLYSYQKIPASPVNVLFSELDISNLLTGNYNLVIEVRSKNNELLAIKQLFFQRYKKPEAENLEDLSRLIVENTFVEPLSLDALDFHLRSVIPIANISEAKKIKELVKSWNENAMKQNLLFFWLTRNANDPRAEWGKYQAEVKKVNDNYGTPLEYGFQTDRGRVYLQYGPPTEILSSGHEPGALPYEVWQYNEFEKGQTNVKFVFYNPDLVSNNYLLLHSNANGEIKNEQWQRVVHEQFSGGETPLDPGSPVRDHYGSKAKQFYNEE